MLKLVSTKNMFGLILTILVILLDQVSKYWVSQLAPPLTPGEAFFQISYSENTGIALGIPLTGLPLIILTVVLIFTVILGTYCYLDFSKKLSHLILGLVLGGALSNWLDRFFQGFVIDFIKIGSYPLFNLADTAICAGILLVIWKYPNLKKN